MDVFWNYTMHIGDSKLYLFPFSDLSVYASDLTDYFSPRSCAEEPVPRFCCVEQPQHFENKNCCTWQYCKTAQIIPNSTPHTVSRMGQSQHRSTSRSQKPRVVTKILSCRVFVVSSRGSRKQSWSTPPPPNSPQEVFEVQLLPFSKRHYRPKIATFIKSTAIINGFRMITSLLKKTTTFWEWEYTCKHRVWKT